MECLAITVLILKHLMTHYREKNLAEIKTKSAKLGFKYLIVLWDHENFEIHKL